MINESINNKLDTQFLEKKYLQQEIEKLNLECLQSRNTNDIQQKTRKISELQYFYSQLENLDIYSSNLSTRHDE